MLLDGTDQSQDSYLKFLVMHVPVLGKRSNFSHTVIPRCTLGPLFQNSRAENSNYDANKTLRTCSDYAQSSRKLTRHLKKIYGSRYKEIIHAARCDVSFEFEVKLEFNI